ncbi:thermophilic serine proteinase [Microcystis aeruginosa NIES-2519]|uniref:Thermophilic serine proteinase n=1 Tax=Microcystis aeruginosa NIES-2519 TaxID=2303981 RepID=A0A5A5R4Z5_MICAE|nr:MULTISPECIES: S8 family peptidase [Microcystis]AVQ71216.1 peptidase S8 [Microcystis sp. MC19]CCI30863.1 Peptidase S8 and S53, subtilisin, kexin, sedolisin [Microcystis sp. T1-4]GCA69785.1 thermophilic serine proteinase [Microcystis aeruginosa NIES-2519]GCA85194.1 thermophilic serine proteinase [Microcystis aeruginosa NIES-2522]GCA89721.1 thermophilic serine proteinase [Microcystis aeruginosa NIES-4264]
MKKLLLLTLFIIGLGFALFNFTGLANRGEYQSILIDFKDDVPVSVLDEQLNAINKKAGKTTSLNSIFSIDEHLYTVEGDSKLLKTLRNSDLKKYTESIEPDYIYHAFIAPNDPNYSKQWNLRGINIERAWEENQGQGITVAVIDTGVSKVPDLRETEFVEGYDFVNDRSNAEDDNGHGTHVAGTIAQSTNNNYGVAGIAYKAKIMPLKVLSGTGGGTVADIAEAIRFAVDNKADVINMSLGGGGETQVMKEAIEYAYSKGVVIVAAAGNADDNSAAYPARFPHVIGVSAVDASGNKAPYSNFGAGVDIAAPGGSDTGKIIQETIDPANGGEPAFLGFQGTSMAAPHVAGVVALIKAAGIKEPSAVLEVLQQSARKINDDPFNHFGAGQLDAGNALQLALKGQITFRDFWRWLRDNGYLNPRFWIDGGAVAVLPKMAMVLGSYLLAWWLRNYFPFSWNGFLNAGLIFGSSGLFFLRGLYIFDLPQWPFRVMGSSLSDLGGVIQGSSALNPLFASVILPFVLIALLLGHTQAKWLAVGVSLAMAVTLGISAVIDPTLVWLGSGRIAQAFLGVNALLCLGLGYLALKSASSSRYA